MAGEIFISYRRADEAWARLLHAQLRAEGVEAWYDAQLGAGQDWRVATAKALQASRIFVLLFSQAAAESEDVAKELAAAIFSKKLVVPVRIENIQPTGAFLYELASRNWVNAFENTEAKLVELAQSLAKLVKAGVVDESIIPFDRNVGAKTPAQKRSWLKRNPLFIGVAAAIVMVAALAALFWIYPRPPATVASLPALLRPAGISIAVLPFLNLSSDKEQEFFSDGITEEITSALAKVPGLTVIGRTSAFQFKGENKDMRAIGQALGVSNLIEGSVRKAGNQVRITAQLIKAADGTHLWTESYDRKLTDIFAVQEDIATAIAGALQVPLGLKPGQSLVSNRTADTDSYQDYLRAKELYRARGFTNFTQAITLLENVIARDPNYAPAWALLANIYVLMPVYPSVSGTFDEAQHLRDVYLPKTEAAARKAVSLDANNADALGALGQSLGQRYKFIQAEDTYRQGLKLDPNNLIILSYLAHGLSAVGHLKESLAIWQKLNKLDPLDTRLKLNLARILALTGQYDAAVAIYMKLGNAYVDLAQVYAAQGRFQEAADQLLRVPTGTFPAGMVESASRLLRSAPMQVPSPQDLPALTPPLQFVYLYVGASSRAIHIGEPYWFPAGVTLRNSQSGKAYEREHGFLDYWRARGWPDLCHPVGADDYACN
ncbi:MAG TPA: TIR domain-containing protein [Rhizomicrobium sp.]|nr:TIR domain-containing protein [Rhizomicrobium sp.]